MRRSHVVFTFLVANGIAATLILGSETERSFQKVEDSSENIIFGDTAIFGGESVFGERARWFDSALVTTSGIEPEKLTQNNRKSRL